MLTKHMVDYIANSKNRKFKKQVLTFFERLNFWAGKLPMSGRLILFLDGCIFLSLFFPWISFEFLSNEKIAYSAFSVYTGYIWYGVLFSVMLLPVFLLSHIKKEKIRALVPFRLSDTQAVVFIASMLFTAELHTIFISPVFSQFAQVITVWNGFLFATSSTFCILIAAFFLSRSTKEAARKVRYLDHRDPDMLDEYNSIIHSHGKSTNEETDENMKLPI